MSASLAVLAALPAQNEIRVGSVEMRKGAPRWVYFSRDGKTLTTITNRGEFELRSTRDWRVLRRRARTTEARSNPHQLVLIHGIVVSKPYVSYSPDRDYLRSVVLFGNGPGFGAIRSTGDLELWRTSRKASIAALHGDGVIGINAAHTRAATLFREGTSTLLRLWNVEHWQPIATQTANPKWGKDIHLTSLRPVRLLAISNDGASVAVCGSELWRCDRGKDDRWQPKLVTRDATPIERIAYAEHNRLLVVRGGKLVGLAEKPIDTSAFAVSPGGTTIVTVSPDSIQVRGTDGVARRSIPRRPKHDYRAIAVTDDGAHVAAVSTSALHLFTKDEERVVPYFYASPGSMAFTGDKRFLVIPRENSFVAFHPETRIPRTVGANFRLGRCILSPLGTGSKVLAWCEHGFYAVDAARGTVLKAYGKVTMLPLRGIEWMAASPDESRVMVRTAGSKCAIVTLATGRIRFAPQSRVISGRWARDSSHVTILDEVDGSFRIDLDGNATLIRRWFADEHEASASGNVAMRARSRDGTLSAKLRENNRGAVLEFFRRKPK